NDALKIDGPTERVLTSERRFDLEYRVVTTSGEPLRPGVPVLWTAPVDGLELVSPAAGARVPLRADQGADGDGEGRAGLLGRLAGGLALAGPAVGVPVPLRAGVGEKGASALLCRLEDR